MITLYMDRELFILKCVNRMTWVVILLFILGFIHTEPALFLKFTLFFKVILALFLIYRFNPYFAKKTPFTELDRRVCYSCGVFILFIAFTDYITYYVDIIRSRIVPYTSPIVTWFQGTEMYALGNSVYERLLVSFARFDVQ
jgi:hypothetical protein